VTKLFGFFGSRGNQPARLMRVEASGRMSREELRRKLVEISARKPRVHAAVHTGREGSRDEQPPSRTRAEMLRRPALPVAA
jgi:hypothetical protein